MMYKATKSNLLTKQYQDDMSRNVELNQDTERFFLKKFFWLDDKETSRKINIYKKKTLESVGQ